MNEEAIQNFITITDCDRRTAVYCVSKFGGNLQIALSFYYDLGGSLRVPPEFSLEQAEIRYGLTRTDSHLPNPPSSPAPPSHFSSSRLSNNRSNNNNNNNRNSTNSPSKQPQKSNSQASYVKSEPNLQINANQNSGNGDKFFRNYPVEDEIKIPSFLKRKKPIIPEVFFPNPQISHLLNDSLPSVKKEDICIIPPKANKPEIIKVKDLQHFVIILYKNGILCDYKDFIQTNDPKYNDLYNSISKCEIPEIFPIDSDVEIINKIEENYRGT